MFFKLPSLTNYDYAVVDSTNFAKWLKGKRVDEIRTNPPNHNLLPKDLGKVGLQVAGHVPQKLNLN